MPTVANSDIDIASRALVLIGAEPITSFTAQSTEAIVANAIYEDMVRTTLCSSRWRFATNQAELNLLTAVPTGRYDRAHQLPADLLMLHAVTVSDLVIEYNVYGDKVFSDSASSDSLIADYTFRALEQDFPSYFTVALQFSLAAAFALGIARDEQLSSVLEGKGAQLLQQAKTLDSQQQTTRKLLTSRFITERRS
jgi:hypothetical protein|tara:strand:+ start:423 stop:1007 length:585 start_codon:yes stop_codon:yes gene_type:complete